MSSAIDAVARAAVAAAALRQRPAQARGTGQGTTGGQGPDDAGVTVEEALLVDACLTAGLAQPVGQPTRGLLLAGRTGPSFQRSQRVDDLAQG